MTIISIYHDPHCPGLAYQSGSCDEDDLMTGSVGRELADRYNPAETNDRYIDPAWYLEQIALRLEAAAGNEIACRDIPEGLGLEITADMELDVLIYEVDRMAHLVAS
jgi:hypothetical protein